MSRLGHVIPPHLSEDYLTTAQTRRLFSEENVGKMSGFLSFLSHYPQHFPLGKLLEKFDNCNDFANIMLSVFPWEDGMVRLLFSLITKFVAVFISTLDQNGLAHSLSVCSSIR